MAIFFARAKCPLCSEEMSTKDHRFSTWGVWLDPDDQLFRYCDASMHWDCYTTWSHRDRFAETYFQFWVSNESNNPYCQKAVLNERCMVTVNHEKPVESVWIYVRESGARYAVRLEIWEEWLRANHHGNLQHFEASALKNVQEALLAEVPTRRHLLERIDLTKKRPPLSPEVASILEKIVKNRTGQ